MKRWKAKFVSILPFEPEFFSRHGLNVEFYGHPLVDSVKPDAAPDEFRASIGVAKSEKVIAVLPGSRLQEIRRILPATLLSLRIAQREIGDLRIISRPVDRSQNRTYSHIARKCDYNNVEIYNGSLYNLLSAADLTLVASGTATVEAAICRAPSIVLYRTNWLTYLIAKRLVNVDYIAMANIVAGKQLFPELIQSDVNPERIAGEVIRLLKDPGLLEEMRAKTAEILPLLGESNAYEKACRAIVSYLSG
jgi:lipid-A-disaccharide synthase